MITPVFAFDCSLVQDVATCISIQNSDLNTTEKEELYHALTYTEFPDYGYVSQHNKVIEWDEAPEGIPQHNSRYIKNAWITLASVMPSVSINGTLHYNGTGEILTGSNYDIQIPSGTAHGDCKTRYDVNSVSRSFTVYANGKKIGYSDLVSFNSNTDLDLKTEMTVKVDVSIRHYKWQRNKYGGKTCKYSSTETDTDSLTVSDAKKVFYLGAEPNYSLEIQDQGYDSFKGQLDVTNATAFDFSIGEGDYQKRGWYYSYNLSYAPYSILTVVAEPYKTESANNIDVSKNSSFTVQHITPCSITLYSHFGERSYNCDQPYEDVDIGVATDKQFYKIGEPIIVTITPSDTEVLLTYGDTEERVTGAVNLTATQSGLIKISSGGKSDSTEVYVSSENWSTFWSIGWFGSFLYVFSNVSLFLWRKVHP